MIFFIVANKKRTRFFYESAGNNESNLDLVVTHLNEAHLFVERRDAQVILDQPKTKEYWSSGELVRFLRTAVIHEVEVLMPAKPGPRDPGRLVACLRSLVAECTPPGIPSDKRPYGASAPNRETLETARAALDAWDNPKKGKRK